MTRPLREPPPGLPGRTLVLGAGGFLGSRAALWLARTRSTLRLFDLSVDSIPDEVRETPGVEVVHGNLLDATLVASALEDVDTVLHFVSATVPATSVTQVDVELRANVQPTVCLLEAMRTVGTPLVVFPSSGGTVYGDEAPERGFSESSPLRPAGAYGLGKLLIEQILSFYAQSGGPHGLVLRIANAYGPSVHRHSRQGVINAFLDRVRAGEPLRIWGDGSAVRDFVHVEDVVSAISALVRCGARDEIFNIGSGGGRSLRELVDVIRRVTGHRPAIERVEGEWAGVRRSVLDVSKLRSRTGWEPRIGLDEGIAHLWETVSAHDVP